MSIRLKRGDGGPNAKEFERSLIVDFQTSINCVGAMLVVDGDFGIATEQAVKYVQQFNGYQITGMVDNRLLEWSAGLENPFPSLNVNGIAYIAQVETGGLSYYHRNSKFPHYPGGPSGITIGVGYDIGQQNANEFRKTWQQYLSAEQLNELIKDVRNDGKSNRGSKARARSLARKGIEIPFNIAWQVFAEQTLPAYFDKTADIYPSLLGLPDHCRSALVSLVYNRGNAVGNSDRRREMKNIQSLLAAADDLSLTNQQRASILIGVENEFDKMKRLWQTGSGLIQRRQAEANMWRKGVSLLKSE